MKKNKKSPSKAPTACFLIAFFCICSSFTCDTLSTGLEVAGIGLIFAVVAFFLAREKNTNQCKASSNYKPSTTQTSDINTTPKPHVSYDSIKGRARLTPKQYVVLDFETTGLSPEEDSIIEAAIIRVENGEVVNSYQTLVNPGFDIPHRITSITGIKTEDVINAPNIHDVLPRLMEIIGDAPIVAHNASFDVRFFGFALYYAGIDAELRYIDTVSLSKSAFPNCKDHKLNTLITELGISSSSQAHRAMSDVEYTHQLYLRCKDELKARETAARKARAAAKKQQEIE